MRFLRHLFFAAGLLLAVTSILVYAPFADATSKADIVHPIAELDGCRDEAACRTYCGARDNLERVRSCIGFAKKHNLLSPGELEEAERYAVRLGIAEGPGGCRDTRSCEQYCEDAAHLNECLDFAQKHGLRSAEEIADGRRLATVLMKGGALPGGCRTRAACESYCEDPSHMRVCVTFAKQAGFISEDEATTAEKIIPLIESGAATPGNCGRKAACEAYCADPAHLDECLAFAEKAGLMSGEDLAQAKKFAPFVKRGETPGQCRGRKACETYCADPAHFETCLAFGERAGILSADDAALARKTKGKGPGGCQSRQACEQFCTDPAHQEECMAFAEEHGLAEEFSGVAAQVREKLEAAGRAKGEAEADAELRACGQKACGEMIVCMRGVATRSSGDGDASAEAHPLPPDLQGKLDACIAEETARQIQEATGGAVTVPIRRDTPQGESTPPSGNAQEEAERRTREEQQRQYDEEVRRQTEAEIKRQTEAEIRRQTEMQNR